MRAPLRQRRTSLQWINALVIVAMVLMPAGMPMPAVPGADAMHDASSVTVIFTLTNPLSALTEDDFEVEHHEFTVPRHPSVAHAVDGSSALTSCVWTERLHRPPIG